MSKHKGVPDMSERGTGIEPVPVDENNLEEVIRVIKGGLHFYPQGCGQETNNRLTRWVNERETELGQGTHILPERREELTPAQMSESDPTKEPTPDNHPDLAPNPFSEGRPSGQGNNPEKTDKHGESFPPFHTGD